MAQASTEKVIYNRAGQRVVSPDYLLFEAPRTKHFMTGSEAVKEAVKRSSVDASVSYPITPQSEAAHLIGELWVRDMWVFISGASPSLALCLSWQDVLWLEQGV